jgi:PhnB protein
MARVSTYLNFPGTTEEAFTFYRSVFGGEFNGPVHRFGDMPAQPGQPPMAPAERQMVMHVELPILGGHVIMGTDAPESMGFTCKPGNNTHLNLEPDTRAEADRLFNALSAGGKVEMPMQDMFWGAYFGSCTDRFGINWMVNCASAPP